jgi:hypothetical protein
LRYEKFHARDGGFSDHERFGGVRLKIAFPYPQEEDLAGNPSSLAAGKGRHACSSSKALSLGANQSRGVCGLAGDLDNLLAPKIRAYQNAWRDYVSTG